MHIRTCKNVVFYQDHLLAERLYGSANEEVDGIAEKSVGVTGGIKAIELIDALEMMEEKLKSFPVESKENGDLFKFCLKIEEELIQFCTKSEKEAKITLGLKNMLADIADRCEGRVYLLKQRLKK